MASQFELGTLFRLTTVAGLLFAWQSMARNGNHPDVIFFALCAPGVFILAPLVMLRRRGSVADKVLVGVGFVLGWATIAVYLAAISILFNARQYDWSEDYAGLEPISAGSMGSLLFLPMLALGVLLYRCWTWSMHDVRISRSAKERPPG